MSGGGMWYVSWQGKVQGPIPWTTLQQLVKSGRLKPEMSVSQDKTSWTPASQVAGLFLPEEDFLGAAEVGSTKARARDAAGSAKKFAEEAKVALSNVPKKYLLVPLVLGILLGVPLGQILCPAWFISDGRLIAVVSDRVASKTRSAQQDFMTDMSDGMRKALKDKD